ncbi:MAG: ABC transporter permease, partial [SAR324 cluster bacterium]|nr:ABC transporter permease [SAR324 cluster bacterium]
MKYELFVGKRYLFSSSRDRSISLITWISICGVALGNIALIASTSIMNGFRDNLRRAVTGSLPHITMFAWDDNMADYEDLIGAITNQSRVVSASPYIFKQALLTGKKQPKGALLRGIDTSREANVTSISAFLRKEVYPIHPPSPAEQQRLSEEIISRLNHESSQKALIPSGVILGAMLAQNLKVRVGDHVQLISSEQRMTPFGDMPRIKDLEVVGIFESGISGYDEVLAFMDYHLVQKIYGMGHSVTGIGIRVEDPELAPQIASALQKSTENYLVSNWADENKSIFQIMKLEKVRMEQDQLRMEQERNQLSVALEQALQQKEEVQRREERLME